MRRSYCGPVQAIARSHGQMVGRRGFQYNKDKTECFLQDGMRTGNGSYESASERTPMYISIFKRCEDVKL